ncbi:winged helix-turn-helix transcriptional regulator [Paenibacillus solisilvae]|uniref:Winged helix-turn-helix transcriptional regulator n=1 Tax=Paenibacillus solisilvae TaxID=2486751 RepID=A0ABW0W2Y3_9BACL
MMEFSQHLCPKFERALEILGKRWTSMIVYQLLSGPYRFVNLEQSIPNLSGKVLSERLKELEAEGIIQRDVYPETPVRIEYKLTEKGRGLAPLFTEIAAWAEQWMEPPADLPES